MLEAACRGSKLDGILGRFLVAESVNQPGGKRIAAADAINDLDVVTAAEMRLAGGVVKSRPAIARGGEAFAQRDGHALETEPIRQGRRYPDVKFVIDFSLGDFGRARLDAENFFGVLFIGDADVDVFHESTHHLAGLLARPEFFAEIEIAAHGETKFLRGASSFQRGLGRCIGKRGCDAGEVEPIGAFEKRVPIEIGGIDFGKWRCGHGRMVTVEAR